MRNVLFALKGLVSCVILLPTTTVFGVLIHADKRRPSLKGETQ